MMPLDSIKSYLSLLQASLRGLSVANSQSCSKVVHGVEITKIMSEDITSTCHFSISTVFRTRFLDNLQAISEVMCNIELLNYVFFFFSALFPCLSGALVQVGTLSLEPVVLRASKAHLAGAFDSVCEIMMHMQACRF
jgi:hypothetical protein